LNKLGIGAATLLGLWLCAAAEGAGRLTQNLVLVTLDGARWQEVFTGLDEGLLKAPSRFSGVTPEERRSKLMPFLWSTLVSDHGFIAGNRSAGGRVSVTNRHWFSYPGYSEILTGQAHDDTIDSNDAKRNPYPSVLQFLKRKLNVDRSKVAVFASWYVFPWIVENREGDITANAGLQQYESTTHDIRVLNNLMLDTPTGWDGVRHDVYTFRFGLDYLQRVQPRVLYLAFDETDDFAHDGKYDRLLEALHRSDGFLRQLWDTLQRHPTYRGRTSLIITVDHGRGRTTDDWRNHGAKVPGADEIWFAIASPDISRRGEWRDHPPLFQNQIAATMADLLGFDYREQNPEAGPPILTKH
jgi:hypothetical protein